MAISRFEWEGLPPEIDSRFLELGLFTDGAMVFFRDEELGQCLCLKMAANGPFNVYNIPVKREAYAANGYHRNLDESNSVIIYNNLIHTPSQLDTEIFAMRLYELDRAIEVNCKAQKTPILIKCNETERLTMKNLYMKYEGNEPYIFGTNGLNTDNLQVLKTDAPFTAPEMYNLRTQIWNEALSYLGISSSSVVKAERVNATEVNASLGASVAARYSYLCAREYAAEQINKLFGLNVKPLFRTDMVEAFNQEFTNINSEESQQGFLEGAQE